MDLLGGTQSATFAAGGLGLAGTIGTIDGGHAVGDSSTFHGDVAAVSIHVHDGAGFFRDNVVAVDATVAAGTIDFNADSGTTSLANRLTFDGAGVANFHQNTSVGTINFNGFGGTVNVSAGKNLVGDVRNYDFISLAADGTLNFLGGTSVLTGGVGTGGGNASIALLNVGKDAVSNLTVTGAINAAEVRLSHGSTLTARGDIVGAVTTTTTGTGVLTLTNGDQTISGSIGTAAAHLAAANVGATGTTTTLNGSVPTAGMSYIDLVTFAGNGTLLLNGANNGGAAAGLVGAVDFTAVGTGTLAVGSGVNLTFGADGLTLRNANAAHLDFLGDSTVVGQIGAPAVAGVLATSTPRDIYAGVNGATVNFGGKVFVSATTFHVVGTGTVNFADDLVGPLVYEANGTVNFADTKGVTGVVTTTNDDQGVLNYLGSTTLAASVGAPGARLKSVNFHTDTAQASATQLIGQDIYAVDTRIGNTGLVAGEPTVTVASIVGDVHLGTTVTLADASTTLYTSGAQTLAGVSVDFAHTKNADGTLSLGTISRSTLDADLVTNGGTLGFAVAATPFGTFAGANGLVDAAASSRITSTGGTLVMTGTETIQVAFLGSLRDGALATLVSTDYGVTGPQAGSLLDNSYVIDTTLERLNGDLVLVTHRDAETYVTKGGVTGLRSESMARRLGALAAAGTGYSAGLQTVFDKLDLDQWGYGDNADNLGRQLELLTPAGDGAAVQAAFALTQGAIGTVLDGSADVSSKLTPGNDYWVRAFGSRLDRSTGGEFADFHANSYGLVLGTDRAIGASVLGLALGTGSAKATSEGARAGDTSDIDTALVGVYFRAPVGKFFVNAMVDLARHDTTSDRQAALGARAHGEYRGNETGGALQFGRRFGLTDKSLSLTPVIGFDYARFRQSAYAETGAGDIGLNVAAQSFEQSAASFTVRFAKDETSAEGLATGFNAYLGYKHLLATPRYDSTVSFVGDSQSFDVGGWQETHKGSITGGLSYNYNPRKGVTYSFQYDLESKSGLKQHSVGVRATWSY